jgi:hypothetical protein
VCLHFLKKGHHGGQSYRDSLQLLSPGTTAIQGRHQLGLRLLIRCFLFCTLPDTVDPSFTGFFAT